MKKMFIILIFICINLYASTEEPLLLPGELRLIVYPEVNFILNAPVSGWGVREENLSKMFFKSSEDPKYKFTNGDYLFTELWFRPLRNLKINIGYEGIIGYADSYYRPINLEHRVDAEYKEEFGDEDGFTTKKALKRIKFWRGKIEYSRRNLHTILYKGYGHGGWESEGDIFGFYPEQREVERYRRISGYSIPEGLELDYNIIVKRRNYGKISIATGPEVVWGNGYSFYFKYNYKYRLWVPSLLFKYEEIKWGTEDEYIWAVALTSKYFGVRHFQLEGGILFQPFRVGKEYISTIPDEEESYGDSGYRIEKDKTDYFDAFGIKLIATTRIIPYVDSSKITYTYLGKIAGNLHRFEFGTEKRFTSSYKSYLNLLFQFPVEGPEIPIYEGNESSYGQFITSPRDRDDPLWVNINNRTAIKLSFMFIFDSTPSTWMFKYNEKYIDFWNLNLYENTPLNFIIKYEISYYPGTTDYFPYVNAKGDWIWPGEYDPYGIKPPVFSTAGLWGLKRPIHFLTFLSEISLLKNGLLIFLIKFGEDIATNPVAYTTTTYCSKPLTTLFDLNTLFVKYPFYLKLRYGVNVWGDEEWYRQLGGTVDRIYQFEFKYNINKNHSISLEYTGCREVDGTYFTETLGPYNEFKLSYKGKFSKRFFLWKRE